jgi:Na+/H+ antiporter NhaD/arsenite permease-like protein
VLSRAMRTGQNPAWAGSWEASFSTSGPQELIVLGWSAAFNSSPVNSLPTVPQLIGVCDE